LRALKQAQLIFDIRDICLLGIGLNVGLTGIMLDCLSFKMTIFFTLKIEFNLTFNGIIKGENLMNFYKA